MSWTFVNRAEQISCLRDAIRAPCGGPIVVTGEPQTGRTSLLARALEKVDPRQVAVVRIESTGARTPFSALAALLPDNLRTKSVPSTAVVAEMAAALADPAGRRLVIVVDDADQVDHASMLVVRELHRRTCALPLITHSSRPAGSPGQPDPLDCLRHEPGLRVLRLPPLSRDEVGAIVAGLLDGPVLASAVTALHAATGGNPGQLHDLLVTGRLAERMIRENGRWRLPETWLSARVPSAPTRLFDALSAAWRNLDLEVAEELCRLAAASGLAGEVAPIWACVLLLRGRASDGLVIMDRLSAKASTPRETMVRALLLGLGLGRLERATALLAQAATSAGPARDRLLAHRAWLLAITGRVCEAQAASAGLEPHADREAYVYTLATRAITAMAAGRPQVAVGHLRRTLAGNRHWRAEVPWLAPFLTATLIDALLLAGRITEATSTAADFHAGSHGSGWRIAVTVADLASAAAATLASQGSREPALDQPC
jgi:hypothetical protein